MSKLVAEVSQSILKIFTRESAASFTGMIQSLNDEKKNAVAEWMLVGLSISMKEQISKGDIMPSAVSEHIQKFMIVLASPSSQNTSAQTLLRSDTSTYQDVTISGKELSSLAALPDEKITDLFTCMCKSGLSVLATRFLESIHNLWLEELGAEFTAAFSHPNAETQGILERYAALDDRVKHLSNQILGATDLQDARSELSERV